jgi:CDP-diacylglycerol---glycerol-3-phosphate 3-phosphatidyltransferase
VSRQAFALLNLVLIFGAGGLGYYWFVEQRPDVSGVRGSKMLGSRVRGWYFSNLTPFEHAFVRHGIQATTLSFGQLIMSVVVGVCYAAGLIYTAGFLVLFTGTLDILDGKVARRSHGASPSGAFLDSVIDRYAEYFSYIGLIVFFDSGWQVWAVLLAILGGMMVSYTRARGEGLGVNCEIGMLQRPERFVLLGFGSIFSSIFVHMTGIEGHHLLSLVVALLAVLGNITAVQRIVYINAALKAGRV